ncbi:hypothetical protein D910_11736 [Dendroctonus ponderosae]|uniref:Uncharacterized protein n=1 Tax=Dendroctonus ponderosae TaxID=77166 RepID=U4UK54_DENPD|nr:hypothetical protein D910_11736 [Dendroctonus ponderosae]KAH1021071.1 hypothetical protein HUJ04_010631 [Dendroctonus ponderosae]KAH1027985.1 hypothetical protein HUJ05_001397 [Dendroctonus ponderosae]KAH1027986.1 hypothetical protein HUJ05_001397 [Dendroctonus ponderosae]KAH1027987.1 hypothetical protein HUJ05_001397 [Dendroctonus ponderosae]
MTDLNLDLNQSLDLRVAQFKNDPEKMAEVSDFLNEVFDKAQKEAELRRNEKSSKGKLTEPKKLEHGPTVLDRLPECLRPGSLPPYVIVPIQCGVLLLLATIIIRKYIWNKSSST